MIRRSFLIGCLLLACASPAQAAYALIGTGVTVGSAAGGTVTTGTYNTTGANFVSCVVSEFASAGSTAVTDSLNGATGWNARTTYNGGSQRITIWYNQSGSFGSETFTATVTGASTFPSISCLAFSGSTATPFDVENGATTVSSTTVQSGSITPGAANELVIAALSMGTANSSITIDGGFSTPLTTNFTGGQCEGVGVSYLIQTSAAAANPTWTMGNNSALDASIASFKSSGAAAAHPCLRTLLGVGCEHE